MPRLLRALVLALLVLPALAAPAAAQSPAGLVINEIDYDQPSTDTAEFLEIRNHGAAPVNLDAYALRLVNGANGGSATYRTVDLPAVDLDAGGYFVVCANPATVAECDLDAGPDTDLIQNGEPDAVALVTGDTIVDAVSYEGAVPGSTEGAAGAPADTGAAAESIARVPDGCDTGDNAFDFKLAAATPGASNTPGTCGGGGIEGLRIHDIQGASHVSPYSGALVAGVPGVVTARRTNGYFSRTRSPTRTCEPRRASSCSRAPRSSIRGSCRARRSRSPAASASSAPPP